MATKIFLYFRAGKALASSQAVFETTQVWEMRALLQWSDGAKREPSSAPKFALQPLPGTLAGLPGVGFSPAASGYVVLARLLDTCEPRILPMLISSKSHSTPEGVF